MSKQGLGMFWLISGLIMLMGAMGGVEQALDLTGWAGLSLAGFTLTGMAMMMVGASYVNDRTDENQGRCP